MDLLSTFLFGLISAAIGGIVILLFQFYIFKSLLDLPEETDDQKLVNDKYFLSDVRVEGLVGKFSGNCLKAILFFQNVKWIAKSENTDSNTPLAALNLVLSFIFQEMQHTDRLRKWFYRKLSLELEELLQKTAMGKFFEKLTVSRIIFSLYVLESPFNRGHNVVFNNGCFVESFVCTRSSYCIWFNVGQ